MRMNHPDQGIDVALERMGANQLELLAVVSRADVHKLEGIVTLHDVLDSYGVISSHRTPSPLLAVSCQNQLLMRRGEAAGLAGAEASAVQHAVNLGESIRIAVWRCAEHPHGEQGSVGRRYAIIVRHELD